MKGTTLVKSNEDVIIQKYSITAENREQHWIKMVINRAATTDSGNYSCTDGKEHRHIYVNVVKGKFKMQITRYIHVSNFKGLALARVETFHIPLVAGKSISLLIKASKTRHNCPISYQDI